MPSPEMLSSPSRIAEAAAPVARGDRPRALRDRVEELLDRLEGDLARGEPFTTVPGIGRELAQRIHETLGITTLEELDAVAHDGRLARVAGFGQHRVRAVGAHLDAMLGRTAHRRPRARREDQLRFDFAEPAPRPPVGLLLELDETYRRLAAGDRLPCMAPRLEDHAHVPVWRTARDGWSFTLLVATSGRAGARHRDRVLIHYQKDGREGRCTVATERQGALIGQRVVRGRERECASHYELHDVPRDVRTWAHALAESA